MRFTDFKKPASVSEALALLKDLGPAGFPLAGGTSLVFATGKEEKVAVDINRIGLDGIAREGGVFTIGSTTRLAALQKHHAEGWVLDRVAVRLASQQLRNMSTLGGNIARVFPWSDFAVVLQALDARMVIAGDAGREVPADEYFASQPARVFKEGALLAGIKVRAMGPGEGFGYRKQTQAAMGFSLMTAAAVVDTDGSGIRKARVAVGAGVPFPCRVPAAEQVLTGWKAGEDLFRKASAAAVGALKFKGAAGMSEEYVRHLADVLIRDAVAEAWTSAKGEAS